MFTKKDLNELISSLNQTLAKHGVKKFMRASARYDYIGIDIFDDGGCLYTLDTGKPRELRASAYEWAFGQLADAVS